MRSLKRFCLRSDDWHRSRWWLILLILLGLDVLVELRGSYFIYFIIVQRVDDELRFSLFIGGCFEAYSIEINTVDISS